MAASPHRVAEINGLAQKIEPVRPCTWIRRPLTEADMGRKAECR
jgi:hypothetical protein